MFWDYCWSSWWAWKGDSFVWYWDKFFLFCARKQEDKKRLFSSLQEEIWRSGNPITQTPWMLAEGKLHMLHSPQVGTEKQTIGRIFLLWSSHDSPKWSWTVLFDLQLRMTECPDTNVKCLILQLPSEKAQGQKFCFIDKFRFGDCISVLTALFQECLSM